MSDRAPSPLYQQIYALVKQIPPGQVTTYGRIGQLLGCSARTVGFAMAALRPGSDVPWQRVINREGKVSPRRDGEGNLLQQELLQAEGVCFDSYGVIDLDKFAYDFPNS